MWKVIPQTFKDARKNIFYTKFWVAWRSEIFHHPIKDFELETGPLTECQNDVNNWIVNLGTQIFIVDNHI